MLGLENFACLFLKDLVLQEPDSEYDYILNPGISFNLISMSFTDEQHVKRSNVIAFLPNTFLANETFKKYTSTAREEYESILNFLTKKVEEGSVASLKNQKAAIVCKNCGSSKVNMTMKQTRSADEGMTLFFACVKCDARWKVQ